MGRPSMFELGKTQIIENCMVGFEKRSFQLEEDGFLTTYNVTAVLYKLTLHRSEVKVQFTQIKKNQFTVKVHNFTFWTAFTVQ